VSTCQSCGHEVGEGRFCTQCGAPMPEPTVARTVVPEPTPEPAPEPDWRTDTAERSLPRTPPSVVAPPPPPRYPLYADEVAGWTPYGPIVSTRPAPPTPTHAVESLEILQPAEAAELSMELPAYREPEDAEVEYADEDYEWVEEDERRSPALWGLAAVVVLAVVGTGWWFLARDTGDQAPVASGSSPSSSASAGGKGTDVAGDATASAPKSAPPNEDVDGQRTTYVAANMVDGKLDTAWRTPGAANGMTLTFTLAAKTTLTQVGLVNGYAKKSEDGSQSLDWYAGNRRVKAVVWGFADGTKVRQQLEDGDREVQLLDLDTPVTTSKVTLKIVRVTAPGTGPSARNFTAVSEVSLVGSPAS
jgi:hypothetical protein